LAKELPNWVGSRTGRGAKPTIPGVRRTISKQEKEPVHLIGPLAIMSAERKRLWERKKPQKSRATCSTGGKKSSRKGGEKVGDALLKPTKREKKRKRKRHSSTRWTPVPEEKKKPSVMERIQRPRERQSSPRGEKKNKSNSTEKKKPSFWCSNQGEKGEGVEGQRRQTDRLRRSLRQEKPSLNSKKKKKGKEEGACEFVQRLRERVQARNNSDLR